MANRTHYYSFTNEPQEKFGVVTIAIKAEAELDQSGKLSMRVGFSLTDPDANFDKDEAKKAAKKSMLSSSCVIMLGRSPKETLMYSARVAWQSALRDEANVPEWAKNLDLAMKAVLIT